MYAPAGSSVIETFSAFSHDTWHVNPRLNLTYGVRWELTPAPSYKGFQAGNSIGTAQLPTRRSAGDLSSVQQRNPSGRFVLYCSLEDSIFAVRSPIGVAYRLTRDGTLVIRSGSGIFYDVGFSAIADTLNGTPFNRWIVGLGAPSPSEAGSPVAYGYAPDLKLPWSAHWNVTLEKLFLGIRSYQLRTLVRVAGVCFVYRQPCRTNQIRAAP